jgi:hypothetical protein
MMSAAAFMMRFICTAVRAHAFFAVLRCAGGERCLVVVADCGARQHHGATHLQMTETS